MNIYKVSEGDIQLIASLNDITKNEISKLNECNWQDECVVLAEGDTEAFVLAKAYDSGKIQQDNKTIGSDVLVCIEQDHAPSDVLDTIFKFKIWRSV